MPAHIETMAYAAEGGVPWHKLGTSVERDAFTTRDGLRIAGLDWTVAKQPLFVPTSLDGDFVEVPGYNAVMRDTDKSILGVVSSEYSVLQNAEAMDIVDSVLRDAEVEVRWETMGALKGGKEIFGAARIPENIVVGDGDVQYPYLMIRTGHDGTTALDILPTVIRPVCWNTVTLALSKRASQADGARGGTMTHIGDVKAKTSALKRSLNASIRRIGEYEKAIKRLADTDTTGELMREYLDILFPPVAALPEGSTPHYLTTDNPRVHLYGVPDNLVGVEQDRRSEKIARFMKAYNEETPTAWGLFNAATGYSDHMRYRMRRNGESAMTTKLWGSGAKFKLDALNTIRDLVGV